MIQSLKMLSSLDSCVNKVNSLDKTKSFLSSFLKKCNQGYESYGYFLQRIKNETYSSGCEQFTTQSIRRFIQINGLADVVNGFWASAAFDRTINAFLKFVLSHSVGVVNLSKTSLGNLTICSEYFS